MSITATVNWFQNYSDSHLGSKPKERAKRQVTQRITTQSTLIGKNGMIVHSSSGGTQTCAHTSDSKELGAGKTHPAVTGKRMD